MAFRRAVAVVVNATTLVTLVIGAPIALLHFGANPLLGTAELARGPGGGLLSLRQLTPLVIILLWVLWLLVVVSLLAEGVARVRGIDLPRLPVLRPVQGMAAALIAGHTAGLLTPASAAMGAAAINQIDAHSGTNAVPAAAAVAVVGQHSVQAPATSPATAPARYDTRAATVQTPFTVGSVTLVVGDCGYTYRVVDNDSLWRIAKVCLGDPERWPEIWDLNQGRSWPQVSGNTRFRDPDLIFPGWVLTLPADAVPPPGAEAVAPPVTADPLAPASVPSPSLSTSASPTAPPPRNLSPSVSAPAGTAADGDDGMYVAPSVASNPPSAGAFQSGFATPSESPAPAATSAASPAPIASGSEQAPARSGPSDGINLPGGWIPVGLGAGLVAAVAMVWRHRRHCYRPTPVTAPRLADPDLVPPLAAVTRIRQTLRRSAPESLTPATAVAPTVRDYHAAETRPALPPIGPSGADLAGAGTLPLSAGLGLQGPAALDAARGLLVATLTSGSHDDPDAEGRAIIPAATLATLLGVSALEFGSISRLTVTDTVADAITDLEEEVIRRARLTADAQTATVHALRDNDIHAEPLPQVLLISEVPDPAWINRLTTAVGLGYSVDIGAAFIGPWPPGTTLHVAEDGTTGDSDEDPRLAVLDVATTLDMLGLLRESCGDHESVGSRNAAAVGPPSNPPAPVAEAKVHSADGDAPAPTPPSGASSPVTVRVLGCPAIIGDNGQPVGGLRAKALELLVYLAVHRGGAALGDIMESLFPDATMRRASERLSTVVANLRGVIRRAATASTGDPDTAKVRLEPVVNTGGHYHLDPRIVVVDWWAVTDHYATVARAADDLQRLAHLTAALDASGGPLADGTDYDWIDTDREVVRRHQIKLHTHAAALHAEHDPHRAWHLLEQACELDPLSEELACQAMRAAAGCGDTDAVRHRLKTLRDALDKAGIELAGDTAAFAKDLLRQRQRPPWPEQDPRHPGMPS
ncbi:BTAD domain-containing putative transcriptional regulator [Rhizocola hellebori]|nr:BTAD domain-containing putative transcriptional regulator [Rhizocola hellebori]